MPPAAKGREIELDFIRGLAILLVLDFHSPFHFLLWPTERLGWQSFGWAGVDVFFVLSGFLVGGLLIKEWKLRGKIDAKRFLIRRGFKIWPQYYAFLLLILVTRHRTWTELRGNFLNIQNYAGGIAHTWTLAVEEHAYLLIALFLYLAARARTRERTVFATVAAATVLVILWRFYLAFRGVDTFIRTDTRIDGIFYGVLLAMLYHLAPPVFTRLQSLKGLWLAVLGVTLAVLRLPFRTWWMPPAKMLVADLTGVAMLLLLYRRRPGQVRGWAYRAIAWIGLYSYGIYLWHVMMSNAVLGLARRFHGWQEPVIFVVLYVTSAIGIGALTTRFLEFPALALRDRLFPRRTDSAAGTPAEVEQRTHREGPVESQWVASE